MKRTLLLILVIGVILLGACGAPTATEFVITGLRVVPTPEMGENSYRISVDVENTGDSQAMYQLSVKIDDVQVEYYAIGGEQVKPIQVILNPDEKQTVTLSAVELIILGLGSQYKQGEIDQDVHTISVDGLSTTVTLVKSLYKLQLLSTTTERVAGYMTVSGQVKNISDESLQNVQAIVEFYASDGTLIKSDEALIEYNPVSANQTSPFEIITTDDLDIAQYKVSFKFLLGNIVPTEDKR